MRIGYNPLRNEVHQPSDCIHQVIVPVYIPNDEGYFKDGLKILDLCLQSLFKTAHSKTFITIVNNGSSPEVAAYLDGLLRKRQIDELIHTINCGKLNAILKGLSGNSFPLITIADSDVLFLNNWQQETYRIFHAFPKAGAVCPTPSSKSYKTYTYNIWFELFFSKSLSFTKVKNPDALQAFADSIGNPDFYNQSHKEWYLTVTNERKQTTAVVGAGHFLVTYKNEVFEKLPVKYSNFKLGGDSEKKILDLPVVKNGLWRLSTQDNYAFHMGNTYEDWMADALEKITQETYNPEFRPNYKKIKMSKLGFLIQYQLFAKLMARKKVVQQFLIRKGLTKTAAKNY